MPDNPIQFAEIGQGWTCSLIFLFRPHEVPSREPDSAHGDGTRGFNLGGIRRELREQHPRIWNALIEPVDSFFSDIVAPVFRADTAPLVALCEPPTSAPAQVTATWPDGLTFAAEDHERELDEGQRLARPLSLNLRDSMAFFSSGHVAYALTLWPATGERDATLNDLLLLQKLVDPTESIGCTGADGRKSLRELPAFRLAGFEEDLSLARLAEQRFRRVSEAAAESATPFPGLLRLVELDAPRFETSLAKMLANPQASCVVQIDGNGSRALFDIVTKWGQPEVTYDIAIGQQDLQLAGVIQNVLDFKEQDASEIRDSLQPAYASIGSAVFSRPRFLHEISVRSRPLKAARESLGINPYIFYTELCITYNEALLSDSESDVAAISMGRERDSLRPSAGHSLREIRTVVSDGDTAKARKGYDDAVAKRMNLYRILHLPYLPNIFRYPTERQVYEKATENRGLDARKQKVETILGNHQSIIEDLHSLSNLYQSERITGIVTALAIVTLISGIADGLAVLTWEKDMPAGQSFFSFAQGSIFLFAKLALLIVAIILVAALTKAFWPYARTVWRRSAAWRR